MKTIGRFFTRNVPLKILALILACVCAVIIHVI